MTRSDAQAIAPMPGHPFSVCISSSEPVSSETPSTKPQAPVKFQISNTKPQIRCRGKRRAGRFLSLELGASLELGVWNWELVARALSFSKIEKRPCSATALLPEQQSQTVEHNHHRAALVSNHADRQRNAAKQREAHQDRHRAERDDEVLTNHLSRAPAEFKGSDKILQSVVHQ